MSRELVVIDLSHHNPEPDFAKVKASGIIGVIFKATEGLHYVDKTFAPRRARARAAGLLTASYHYLKHGGVPGQMDHYCNTVQPVPGERMIIDYEDEALQLDELRHAVALLQGADDDLQVSVYGGSVLEAQLGKSHDQLLATTSLWTAQYTNAAAPSWPTGTWPRFTLWQFTDKAKVPGISAPVDGNRFNGPPQACARWFEAAGWQRLPGQPGQVLAPAVEVDGVEAPAWGDGGQTVPQPTEAFGVHLSVPPDAVVQITVNGIPYSPDGGHHDQ